MKVFARYRSLFVPWSSVAVLALLAVGCRPDSSATTSQSPKPASEETPATEPENQHGEVRHVDEAGFGQLVLQAEGPVLVDFYAEWCPPCKMIAPILEDLAKEHPHVLIAKVDVDQNPGLASKYGISAIPSLKVFQDGRVVESHEGFASKDALKSLLGLDSAASL